jgi:hypothetical protein
MRRVDGYGQRALSEATLIIRNVVCGGHNVSKSNARTDETKQSLPTMPSSLCPGASHNGSYRGRVAEITRRDHESVTFRDATQLRIFIRGYVQNRGKRPDVADTKERLRNETPQITIKTFQDEAIGMHRRTHDGLVALPVDDGFCFASY